MDKLVAKALKLMRENGLQPDRNEAAEDYIWLALMETAHDWNGWTRLTQSKEMKDRLAKWSSAARRLLLLQKQIQQLVEGDFASEIEISSFGFDELERRIERTLQQTELLQAVASGPPRRVEVVKEQAAREALKLVRRYGLSDATTRGSPLCQLAAILCGDPTADLHHHCRRAKAGSAEPGTQ